MTVLGDFGISEKGERRGDYIYRDRTLSGAAIRDENMLLEEKFDYIKVFFFTVGRQKNILFKNGFEGPAKADSVPKIDGNVFMKKGELTLNYQLPIMTNGVAMVVDTNHNREILRRLLQKETTEHYEVYYDGNKPKKKITNIELGPYIRLIDNIDISKNKDGISHIMNLTPADKAVFESLQVELEASKKLNLQLEETKRKLEEEKEKASSKTQTINKLPAKPKGRPKKKPVAKVIVPELVKTE